MACSLSHRMELKNSRPVPARRVTSSKLAPPKKILSLLAKDMPLAPVSTKPPVTQLLLPLILGIFFQLRKFFAQCTPT